MLGVVAGAAAATEFLWRCELDVECAIEGCGVAIAASYILLMNSLYRLRSDGTAVLSEAINRSGTVYLRIPGHASGAGEIQVSFGGRLQNIRAYTHGPELSNGTGVRVIALHGERALMVERLS